MMSKVAQKWKRMEKVKPRSRRCPNCLLMNHTGHFVPPSTGDKGFFICKPAALQEPKA